MLSSCPYYDFVGIENMSLDSIWHLIGRGCGGVDYSIDVYVGFLYSYIYVSVTWLALVNRIQTILDDAMQLEL